MRVLVTGGAGFIGSHVVKGALTLGFDVAALDDFSTGKRENLPPGVRVFEADLRDRDEVLRAVAEFKPELVSHHAAQPSVKVSMQAPRLDAEVNILGGLNLLDACTGPASRVRRFVFASSGGAIYGDVPEGEPADESFRPEPKSPYGINKLSFERLLRVYGEQRGLPAHVLRYANVYGPGQEPHAEAGVVATFFQQALRQQNLTVFGKRKPGDGGCSRDYVFVGDAVRANLQALAGTLPHALLNVGSGHATSTLELAEQILALSQSRAGIEHAAPRAFDSQYSLLDVARFEQTLGAPTLLATGLAETARWYRER